MELLHDFDAECFRGSGGGWHVIPSPPDPPILSRRVLPADLPARAWQASVVAVAGSRDAMPDTVTPCLPTPAPAAAAACHEDK